MNIVQALLDIGMVVSGVILVREGLRSGKMGSGRSRKVVGVVQLVAGMVLLVSGGMRL